MNRFFQFQTHPFRLLLYLEWILLGITILTKFPLTQVPLPPFPSVDFVPQSSLLSILSLITFGAMGLRLPKDKLLSKILYTSLSFGLIWLAAFGEKRGIYFFPSLLLILVIRSCLIFDLTGRLIVTGLAFITFFLSVFLPIRDIHYFPAHPLRANFQNPLSARVPKTLPAPSPKRFIFSKHLSEDQVKMLVLHLTLNSTLLFGLVLVFVLLLVNALLSERQSRQKLALANDKLRQYALRIEDQATLQERNRIAREIHDSLGHSLTAQSIQLENASMFLPSNIDKAQAFLKEAKRLGSNALREVRQSVAVLRYDPLQGQSLEQAIASLVKDFHRTTGIVPNCRICLSSPLLSDVSIAIYRIVQEALTNIHKHSGATQVIVHLQTKLATVYLLVEDNGRGFKPEQNTTGFGLQGMRERTLALGGQFEIDSAQEVGCRITASFPLAKDSIIKYPKSR